MSKVLVDRELLERVHGGWFHSTAVVDAMRELRELLDKPAEAEGAVEMGSDAWMALHLLDRLDVSADEEPRVQQVEEIVRRMGAALSAVTAERDRLESMLIRTTTRHFAQQWKDSADDKKLDECLSEGIAMLEAERDRLRDQVKALQSDANSWQSGYDKGRHDGAKHRHSEVAQPRAEVEALRVLLSKSLPIVEAHAGASHMLEGFRPTRNKWDELVDGIRAVMAAKEA